LQHKDGGGNQSLIHLMGTRLVRHHITIRNCSAIHLDLVLGVIVFAVLALLGTSANCRCTLGQLWAINAIAQIVPVQICVLTRVADLLRHVVNGICAEEIVLTIKEPHIRFLVYLTCRRWTDFPLAHDTLDRLSMDPVMPPHVVRLNRNAGFMGIEIIVVQTIILDAHFIWVIPSTSIFPRPSAERVLVGTLSAQSTDVRAVSMEDVQNCIVVCAGMNACKFTTLRFTPMPPSIDVADMSVDKVAL